MAFGLQFNTFKSPLVQGCLIVNSIFFESPGGCYGCEAYEKMGNKLYSSCADTSGKFFIQAILPYYCITCLQLT